MACKRSAVRSRLAPPAFALRAWGHTASFAAKDKLTGGAGRDKFDFNDQYDSGASATTRDIITDFDNRYDLIDLSDMDANVKKFGNQDFTFVGKKAFTKLAGELRYELSNKVGTANDRTIVSADVNGDGKADFQIELNGLLRLSKDDFII